METSSHPIRLSLDRMVKAGQAEGSCDLTEIRERMEPEIAALAAECAHAEDLAAMRDSFEVMEGAQKDPGAFIEADLDFHLTLAEAAANPFILSLIDSIVPVRAENGNFSGGGRAGARAVSPQEDSGCGGALRCGGSAGGNEGT